MSAIPAYDAYRQANMAWLDVVPSHWATSSLRWLSVRYSGGTPDRDNQDYWTDGTIPWLNSGAVNDTVIRQPSAFISVSGFAGSSAKWVPQGALVMALAGQGKTKGTVAELGFKATCNQSMAAIIPTRRIKPRYLFWWLASNYSNIRGMSGGDLRDGLNLQLLGDIPVPLPPEGEQQVIADYLDRETAQIDDLVSKQERLIELLAERRQSIISKAVTKGIDPTAPTKQSGIPWVSEVPAHWSIQRTSWLFRTISSGTTPPSDSPKYYGGDTNWVTTGELREAEISSTAKKVTQEALTDLTSLRVYSPGALLVAMYGATIGRLGILAAPAATNQACCVFDVPLRVTTRFAFFSLMAAKEHLLVLASGGGQPNINQEKLRALRIPVPPIVEQQAIVDEIDQRLRDIDSLSKRSEEVIRLLRERRSALVSAAVTGKIDVRTQAA